MQAVYGDGLALVSGGVVGWALDPRPVRLPVRADTDHRAGAGQDDYALKEVDAGAQAGAVGSSCPQHCGRWPHRVLSACLGRTAAGACSCCATARLVQLWLRKLL